MVHHISEQKTRLSSRNSLRLGHSPSSEVQILINGSLFIRIGIIPFLNDGITLTKNPFVLAQFIAPLTFKMSDISVMVFYFSELVLCDLAQHFRQILVCSKIFTRVSILPLKLKFSGFMRFKWYGDRLNIRTDNVNLIQVCSAVSHFVRVKE